jgi:hypothetical protein
MNTDLIRLIEQAIAQSPHERSNLTPDSENQLADMLAQNVVDSLWENKGWAHEIIKKSQLRWPGGILEKRMAHYAQEKKYLAEQFSKWLTSRIRYFLEQHENVYLLIDAGSTNLWFFGSLRSHLSILSKVHRGEHLTIVTNNVPVAEDFASQSQLGHFEAGTRIDCELVGGRVDTRYAAVVGSFARTSLKHFTSRADGPNRYIALATGNFVRLSSTGKSTWPIPLVRGAGQKETKDEFIRRANEVYVLAPLGKIFLAPTQQINEGLTLNQDPGSDQPKAGYMEVQIPETHTALVKLVTTLRPSPDCLLSRHSTAVINQIGEPAPLQIYDTPIQRLHHFIYPFEEHVHNKSPAEQLQIECPHEATAKAEFTKKFYSVRPN